MMPRRLAVLDINDQEVTSFRTGVDIARHFDVRQLRTWSEVQSDVGSDEPFRPDIVLSDIDFEYDPAVKDIVFPGCGTAKPLGPLLALPYVGSRPVWSFGVYSAHFNSNSSSLMGSPWLLFPFGVLFAKLEGQVFEISSRSSGSMESDQKTVKDYMEQIPRLGNPAAALKTALVNHRERLVAAVVNKRVRVTNAYRIVDKLRRLKEECDEQTGTTVQVDPELYVELFSRSHGIDRIKWVSLCADVMNFTDDKVDANGADFMLAYAQDLCGADPVFQMVIAVFQAIDEDEADEEIAFDKRAAELYSGEPEDIKHEVLRLGVLLANAQVIHEGGYTGVNQTDLYVRLGISSGGLNTYKGWFGARTEIKAKKACGWTLKINSLDFFENEKTNNKTCFLEWGGTRLNDIDKERIYHHLNSVSGKQGRNYEIPSSSAC